MPGLVGIVSINSTSRDMSLLRAMRDTIRHKDWYQVDDYINKAGTVAVSRVHLGIINKKKQPYLACNGKVKIFFLGEIYNDSALHSCPLQFIASMYEQHGINFVSALNGSYLIVVINEEKNIVFIANDRIASKPLFYFNDGQTLYFGPEIKSLLLAPTLQKKLNQAAFVDFLTNGYFTREHTLIEDIKTLDSATVLKIDDTNGLTQHKYWNYDFEQNSKKDRGEAYYQHTLAELLRKAVSRRLRTDKTYGILLSGGYDSRGILGCYLEQKKGQETQTISWGREEDIPDSDCVIAKRLAQKLGTNHQFYKLTAEEVIDNFRNFIWLGEGLTWYPESYNLFYTIREQQGVDILLRGDECFGWEGLLVHDEHTMFRTLKLRALKNIGPYQRILKPAYYKLFCELDAETIRQNSLSCQAKNLHNRKDFFYLNIRLKNFINPLNYTKNFALESFTPLLDYDILNFVSTLPVKYRLDKKLYRKTITTMFPDLFEEMAQTRNDIDWGVSLRNSPKLQRFVYEELLNKQSILNEFVVIDNLKEELDSFFSSTSIYPQAQSSIKAKVKAGILKLPDISPAVYNFAHKTSYYGRKWLNSSRDTLLTEQWIIRLLILKVWGDLFLDNYPLVNNSK